MHFRSVGKLNSQRNMRSIINFYIRSAPNEEHYSFVPFLLAHLKKKAIYTFAYNVHFCVIYHLWHRCVMNVATLLIEFGSFFSVFLCGHFFSTCPHLTFKMEQKQKHIWHYL